MAQDLPLSVLGRIWQIPEVSERCMIAMQQNFNLQPLIAAIILRRDIALEYVASYLSPTIRDSMKNPMDLKDMDLAVERVLSAIEHHQKIMIYADYDVDGATSAALLKRYFSDLDYDVGLYIPDRIEEGYGANAQALSTIKDQGYDVVIMCDCGTTAFDALQHAHEIGLDVIVLDHHSVESHLPKCVALVNPHRLDQELTVRQEFGILCAAGVVFCFLAALNRLMRTQNKNDLPHLLNYLDLVALGTVCDVMPLKGMNRAFVTQGLKLMAMRQNVGLSTLMTVSGVDDKISSYHLGFYLGPRINAGGRVGKASMGAELLSTKDPLYAQELAEKLNHYNEERKTIESIMLEQAYIKIEKEHLYDAPVIVVSGRDWHPGVIGIAASRIKERYNKPTIVIAINAQEGKGSGRSVPGLDLGPAMHDAVHQGVLLKGGGHAMAVGLSILEDKINDFREFLTQRFASTMANYKPLVRADGRIALSGVTIDFAKKLLQLEPFGMGNTTPKFIIENVTPIMIMPVGDTHMRITLQDQGSQKLECMAFRVRGTPLEKALLERKPINVLGTLKYDIWNDREKASFFLEDIMMCS